MEEETTRRNSRNEDAEVSASGGWTNTTTAGKALGVSPRTVITYINQGLLEGVVEGEGVRRKWLVSIDSLNALRAQRIAEGDLEGFREASADQPLAEGIGEAMQNIAERLAEESARAAEYRTRLELTEKTESTLREERERLVAELEEERAERHRLQLELEAAYEREQMHRPWWRRLLGS